MNRCIYKEIIEAKNGTTIPLLINNKTIDSRYNPEQSCDKTVLQINEKTGFFIVPGISNGILIEKILQKKPDSYIIGLEISNDDLNFVNQFKKVSELANKGNFHFTTITDLYSSLKNNYLPAIHGNLQVIEQLPWNEINKDFLPEIQKIISKCISEISADYSVQAHFGKIWTHNILNNLKLKSTLSGSLPKLDINKTAAIIAAGPSLESNIAKLKNNRESYTIFSTDTAYQTLVKFNIEPDFVVSIDGQNLSYNHFFNTKKTNTIFLFDLCSAFAAAKEVLEKNNQIYFFKSGHPLSSILDEISESKLPLINNGSGTVTISAFDIAYKLGFTNFEVFGADFSYLNGKSYTKGTYLDSLYKKNDNLLSTSETVFDKLMFRTDLIKLNDKQWTTEILESYKQSFEDYIENLKGQFVKEENIYKITLPQSSNLINFENNHFDYKQTLNRLINLNPETLKIPLLPFISYLRNKDGDACTFEDYMKVALSFIVRYN